MVRHLLVISVLSLAACGGKSPSPPVQNAAPADPVAAPQPAPKSELEVAMARFQELTDKMCGCSEKTCSEAVNNELTRWSEEMAKKRPEREPPKPSEADMKRMTEIGAKYAECMTTAMGVTP